MRRIYIEEEALENKSNQTNRTDFSKKIVFY